MTMTVDESKKKLETAISALIWNFEKDTGVEVRSMDIRKIKNSNSLRFIIVMGNKKKK